MLSYPLKSSLLPPASSNIVLANLCPVSKLARRLEIWFGPNLSLTHQVWFLAIGLGGLIPGGHVFTESELHQLYLMP